MMVKLNGDTEIVSETSNHTSLDMFSNPFLTTPPRRRRAHVSQTLGRSWRERDKITPDMDPVVDLRPLPWSTPRRVRKYEDVTFSPHRILPRSRSPSPLVEKMNHLTARFLSESDHAEDKFSSPTPGLSIGSSPSPSAWSALATPATIKRSHRTRPIRPVHAGGMSDPSFSKIFDTYSLTPCLSNYKTKPHIEKEALDQEISSRPARTLEYPGRDNSCSFCDFIDRKDDLILQCQEIVQLIQRKSQLETEFEPLLRGKLNSENSTEQASDGSDSPRSTARSSPASSKSNNGSTQIFHDSRVGKQGSKSPNDDENPDEHPDRPERPNKESSSRNFRFPTSTSLSCSYHAAFSNEDFQNSEWHGCESQHYKHISDLM
jgi:hypothetical protein